MKGIAGWVALAVVGLVLAAGVGVAAREVSSQDVGLSAEPITVGDELAPAPARTEPERTDTTGRTDTEGRTTPAAPAVPVTPAPSDDRGGESEAGDDNSGKGRGRGRSGESGRGRGGDD